MFRNITLGLFLVCLSMAAFSQQPAPNSSAPMAHREYGMRQMRGMSDQEIDRAVDTLQRTLNLSATQVTNIRQLAQTRRDSMRSVRQEARPKFEQLMALLKQPNPDPATVGRAVIDLKAVHEQFRAKQADYEKQFMALLNPTQQQTVNNIRSQADTFRALRSVGMLRRSEPAGGTFMSGLDSGGN